ncbi:hypothetical protein [Pseudobutyrivibrio sp.]|nr:hypothetical protein [Pseudobutyrivibrio sp.]MBR5649692.1 hypothetical protein [Pseudobutyrivibrio sp.]
MTKRHLPETQELDAYQLLYIPVSSRQSLRFLKRIVLDERRNTKDCRRN